MFSHPAFAGCENRISLTHFVQEMSYLTFGPGSPTPVSPGAPCSPGKPWSPFEEKSYSSHILPRLIKLKSENLLFQI